MFAYCLNKPINAKDASGARSIPTAISLNDAAILKPYDPVPQEKNILEKWKEKGVVYKSNGAGKGGEIQNSYLVTNYQDIYEYSDYLVTKSEYRADFTGSVEAVVYEWEIHNIIYYYGPSNYEESAKHVNFGRTIFSDSHGVLSLVMWLGFYLESPEAYYSDLFG